MTTAHTHLLVRATTTAFALALAIGVNVAAAYTMGGSGTPDGRAAHPLIANLGTLPTVTVRACRANG